MLYSIPFYNALLRKKLFVTPKGKNKCATNSHVLVYGAVSIHNTGEKGCIASNETIGKEIGMTSQTVANCLSDMAKAGWLEVVVKNKRREKVIPKLVISVLSTPEAYSTEEGVYSTEYSGLLQEVRGVTSQSNIDNSRDKSIDNSREMVWQKIVNYFYEMISPETPIPQRFWNPAKESALKLLSLHPEEEIIKKIEALSKSQEKKFITRFPVFCNKYQSINGTNPRVQQTLRF